MALRSTIFRGDTHTLAPLSTTPLSPTARMTTRLQAQEKASSSGKKGEARKDLTLNLDVLAKALKESGINISGNQYL